MFLNSSNHRCRCHSNQCDWDWASACLCLWLCMYMCLYSVWRCCIVKRERTRAERGRIWFRWKIESDGRVRVLVCESERASGAGRHRQAKGRHLNSILLLICCSGKFNDLICLTYGLFFYFPSFRTEQDQQKQNQQENNTRRQALKTRPITVSIAIAIEWN